MKLDTDFSYPYCRCHIKLHRCKTTGNNSDSELLLVKYSGIWPDTKAGKLLCNCIYELK